MLSLAFPAIDPVLVHVGPLAIRWYALAYIVGLVGGWRYCLLLTQRPPLFLDKILLDDFLVWATLGVVLGGRIGYVLFYRPGFYLENPLEALAIWRGGMSFHGGMTGVLLAIVLFARKRGIPILMLGDIIACATPIGLFFGRIANFINGELFGRVSDLPWAMVFPNGGPEPRHPSQIYQAFLEGAVLFTLLLLLERLTSARHRPGLLGGVFLAGYALARMTGELFRQPDPQLGFLFLGTTMGQLLSLPMLAIGLYLIVRALQRPPVA